MYYVYEWYVVNTNEIFYVGKGCNNRYKCHSDRNDVFNQYYNNNECKSRIVKYFDSEVDAFQFEREYIEKLKALGMCSANLHVGGAGGSGELWTEELRKSYSENNVMKRPEQRKRMSISNPMKNQAIAKMVGEKHRKRVIINEKIYESVNDVMKSYHASANSVHNWCIKGINQYGEKCRYEDEEPTEYNYTRYNLGGSKAVIYKGNVYEAIIDLCREINISQGTASEWIKRGFDPNGNEFRYVDDERKLTFENRYVKRNKNRMRPIIVNNIRYKNVDEALKVLPITRSTLYSYLNGNGSSKKYICTYDNQQPSQENVM